MTAILEALAALNQSLDNLEGAAVQQEQKALQIQQQDLFAASGYNMIDPAILAKKLDTTIDRIEQVLREG